MSSTSKRPFLFCGTDGLQAGSYDAPSGSRIENEGAPSHLAVNRSKCWPAGKKIHVRFLDGSLEIQQRVRHWTQSWEEFANIDFKFMADDEQGHADIRVDFQFVRDLGTWSYIGRDAEVGVIEQKHPTMDFGELNGNSPESEIHPFRTHNDGKLEIVPGIRKAVDNLVPLNSRGIDLDPPYLTPPRVALGRAQLDEAHNANIRLNTLTFVCKVGSWSTLEDRGVQDPAQPVHDETSGKIVRRDTTQTALPRNTYAAGQPPQVLTWLTGLDLGKDANWRIMCYAKAITHKGFDLVIETWGNTFCHSASASRVAHPAGWKGYRAARSVPLTCGSGIPPITKTKGKVMIADEGAFDKSPKVFISMSALDMDSAKNIRAKIFANKISSDGFT
ncbi:Metalloprotease [Colletotrichum higginsianum IMI 349063]|uniref:Metalloprotease n=1 Tax=Colletotrichum higginsianum (strain IMI 349063) TaxID=759273 RepID=A0A1B7XQG1_COLHI|nr:Metalloprotease [Colletotrichum higginsianum IMI 349063]OBR01993.1 Metalloprotease [Colletotrichum higginsianum IMI 349063]